MCLARMLTFALAATIGLPSMAQEKLFSGPQPGEKLTGKELERGTKCAQVHFNKWAEQYGGAVSP